MKYFGIIPLIAVIIVLYNLMVFAGGHAAADGTDPILGYLSAPLISIPMISHEHFVISAGDLFVIFGLVTLLQQILRATRVDNVELVNHGISFGLFTVALIEFLLLRGFATATFFILILMTLVDVIAGFVIGLTASRREVEVTREP